MVWGLFLTFLGAVLVLVGPRCAARWLALLTTLAGALLAGWDFVRTPADGAWHTLVAWPWIPSLGMRFHLAVDGISLVMTLVTGLAAVASVLMSWNVARWPREFFFWLLLVVGGCYGVFLSADLFLFFVFYELVIVPKFFLIAGWGSTNRFYGALKLTLYSFLGGALVLIGLLVVWLEAGTWDLAALSRHDFAVATQAWLFPVMFLGFAVLAGIWPLHTWAPTGHVAAPTAGSMLLAGMVMKLGAYGALRVALNFFPEGFQLWRGVVAVLAVAGIVYAAGVALRQSDLKFVIGYSSVSHMGFVLLGLATAQVLGLAGAVLQMFSHGIIAGLLFGVAGRMVYQRVHTRDLEALPRLRLGTALPFAALTFAVASAASMGLPGFSGFVAEITVLLGAWQAYPALVLVTAAGMVLTAAFTLRALKATFFEVPDPPPPVPILEPVTLAERCAAWLLMLATVGAGLFPGVLLDRILPCVAAMRCLQP